MTVISRRSETDFLDLQFSTPRTAPGHSGCLGSGDRKEGEGRRDSDKICEPFEKNHPGVNSGKPEVMSGGTAGGGGHQLECGHWVTSAGGLKEVAGWEGGAQS